MFTALSSLGEQIRIVSSRMLQRLGLREDSFLIVPAILIGIITAMAAVGFHQLIDWIKDLLYNRYDPSFLYGSGLPLIILFPALGGLVVGVFTLYLTRTREGHGIIDVIESVVKANGFVKPGSAIEKIFTSAVTIGTGGSCGAEGPIVQIGAAIASGVGMIFRFARHQMPILIGCGSAAGISAIFNAPIGGVIFTIEVILQDFSIRTFTPLVVASVIANVTTRAIFARIGHLDYSAIFAMPTQAAQTVGPPIDLHLIPTFAFLGILCGVIGVMLTRMMAFFEQQFKKLQSLGAFRPALGGALVGILGVVYVLIFGRLLLGQPKPFTFEQYPMPAFFADGYGVIHELLTSAFYDRDVSKGLLLLGFLCGVKILATCLTLASGGSGGVIAPSLFLGATAGGFTGMLLRQTGWFANIRPEVYALVGMGAVLGAVVHAPLASILIVFELTQDYRVTLPAMLATVFATGVARIVYRDSIYTQTLRTRGIRLGGTDINALARRSVEQISLSPATMLQAKDPAQRIFSLISQFGSIDLVVTDEKGTYEGMVLTQDINLALLDREALPTMIVKEFVRSDIPLTTTNDSLATVLDLFTRLDAAHLPVCLAHQPGKVIGLISRSTLMRLYHQGLEG